MTVIDENGLPSDFNSEGLLAPGSYPLTLSGLRDSLLVSGGHSGCLATWDTQWRLSLVENLAIMVNQLWQVGIEEIFVDGSFAEDKDHPNDIDGYFVCDLKHLASGDLAQQLNRIDPHKIWTWDPASRRPYHGYPKKQLPMWHAYRVELYPHYGQVCGIRDAHGHDLQFPSAFRQSRQTGSPKGIVQIIKEEK